VVKQFTLRNTNGMTIKVITYGAIITAIEAPDRNGGMTNVVAGAESWIVTPLNAAGFPARSCWAAWQIGLRVPRFMIDGIEYKVTANNGANSIHGGRRGFSRVVWQGQALPVAAHEAGVRLTYLSQDGEEGYPGNLTAT